MAWLRPLAVLFAFLAAFVRPAPASAFTAASPETRVGGFEVATQLLLRELGAASREQHQGIGAAYDENATAYRFAARSGTTTLYRTIGEGERASIEATERYTAPLGGVEGKYFYPTAQQAEALARASFPSQGVQTLTSVEVPNAVLQGATRIAPAGEGPALFFTTKELGQLGAPRIWPFWPIGGP